MYHITLPKEMKHLYYFLSTTEVHGLVTDHIIKHRQQYHYCSSAHTTSWTHFCSSWSWPSCWKEFKQAFMAIATTHQNNVGGCIPKISITSSPVARLFLQLLHALPQFSNVSLLMYSPLFTCFSEFPPFQFSWLKVSICHTSSTTYHCLGFPSTFP